MSEPRFEIYDGFRLTMALPDEEIPVGTVGVVLMIHDGPRRAYEVEFPDGRGGNLGSSPTFTLFEDSMSPLS